VDEFGGMGQSPHITSGKMPYNFTKEPAMIANTAVARLEARLPAAVHSMLKRAAEIEGRSLTDFVVTAAQEAAKRSIEQAELIRLSSADQQAFAAALLAPAKPNAVMKRAFARQRKLIST
jgi:uncharacterized protein (DUF1778 family)